MKEQSPQQVDPERVKHAIRKVLPSLHAQGEALEHITGVYKLASQVLDENNKFTPSAEKLAQAQSNYIAGAAIVRPRRRFGTTAEQRQLYMGLGVLNGVSYVALGDQATPVMKRVAEVITARDPFGRKLRKEGRRILVGDQRESRAGKLKRYLEAATREILPGQILKAAGKDIQEDTGSLDNVLDAIKRNQQLGRKVDTIFNQFPDDKEHRFLKSQTLAFEQAYVTAILRPKKRKNHIDKATRALQNIAVFYMNNGHTEKVNAAYEKILQDYLGIKKLTEKHLLISNPGAEDGVLTDLFFKIEQRQRRAGIQERISRNSSGPIPVPPVAA